ERVDSPSGVPRIGFHVTDDPRRGIEQGRVIWRAPRCGIRVAFHAPVDSFGYLEEHVAVGMACIGDLHLSVVLLAQRELYFVTAINPASDLLFLEPVDFCGFAAPERDG